MAAIRDRENTTNQIPTLLPLCCEGDNPKKKAAGGGGCGRDVATSSLLHVAFFFCYLRLTLQCDSCLPLS